MLFMKPAQKYWLFCLSRNLVFTANACTSNAPAPYVSAQNDMTKEGHRTKFLRGTCSYNCLFSPSNYERGRFSVVEFILTYN